MRKPAPQQISQGPVSKYGENVALKLGNRVLTYNQLKQDVLSFGAALHRDYEYVSGRNFLASACAWAPSHPLPYRLQGGNNGFPFSPSCSLEAPVLCKPHCKQTRLSHRCPFYKIAAQ